MIQAADFFTKEYWEGVLHTITDWFLKFGKNILIGLLILFVGNKLIKWVMKIYNKASQNSKMEPIVAKFFGSVIKFALYTVLFIVIIGIMGIPASSFIAVLSATGLTVGLALQGSLSNFAGGVLILLFKPFRIGDYIKEDVHNNEGTVVGIDLCYTKIQTVDNKIVIIPNGTLANSSVNNYTIQKKRRIDFTVGISYGSDIKKARDVINDVINSEKNILKDENNLVVVESLDDSQVTIGVKAWTVPDNYWTQRWDLIEHIKIALDANGIVIPFNQLTVSFSKDEEIKGE